jgi:hypothetical protein
MNWLWFQTSDELLKHVVLLLSGVAYSATIIGTLYGLWRWWFGPLKRHRRAARVLRNEARFRARLNHVRIALELYDLSVRLNPRAGYTYFLRGCLRADRGDTKRAIADLNRCLERLRGYGPAEKKLEALGAPLPGSGPTWPVVAQSAIAGAVVILVFAIAGCVLR